MVWAEASKPARRQRGGPGEGGGSQGVQHPKCCQVQAAWEGSEQAGRAQQAGRLLRTPLLPTLASLLPLLLAHPGVLPSLSPPRMDSPSGWDNPGAGGCTGGLQPGTRLHSRSRSGFQRLRYPSSSSPQGRATPAGAGRLLTPHTGLSSCARGVLNTFFHSSPPSQLAPCERERHQPRARAVQGDTAGDTWCCHPTPGAAPAPDSSSTSSAGGCSPLCVFWGGGVKAQGPQLAGTAEPPPSPAALHYPAVLHPGPGQPSQDAPPALLGLPSTPSPLPSRQHLSGRTRPRAASIHNRVTTDLVFGSLPQ